MTRTPFPGGFYADATPSGAFVVLYRGSHFATHLGTVPVPAGDPAGPGFVRCTDVGGFRFAGQSADALNPAAWEWMPGTNWRGLPPPCVGVSPVIYDLLGVLHLSDGSIGSQGWRYAAHDGSPTGRLVTGDQSYGPFHGLFEYSEAGGLYIGQAAYDNGGVQVWDGTTLRQLELGNCRFIRVQWAGEQVAIAFVVPDGAIIYQVTLAELRALPPVVQPEPPDPQPPDPPKPPDPEPPEPPDPVPPQPPASPYLFIREDIMTPEQGWLIGPGDKAASVDAQGHVTFNTTDLTDANLLELSKPDDRYQFTSIAHGTILGADATKFTPSGNVCLQFYAIPASNRGNYESWLVGTWSSVPIVTAVVPYDRQGADNGRSWTSAALTWVKK